MHHYSLFLVIAAICAITFVSCAQQSRRGSTALEPPSVATPSVAQTTTSKLNINTSSVEEIEKLPGVGKIMAELIVVFRRQYGPFRRVEHLMMVRGFSDHKFRALRELIAVE